MARYRLRFLLQEFDLQKGITLIGRGSDCHVTIEDPLVSRHHARIALNGDRAVVSDLGSRNGVKVNGVLAKEPTELTDGDRLRIGTQELVFCKVATAPRRSHKTTGFLRHCARCRMPYPQEVGQCPSCGATEALDEDMFGSFGSTAQRVWSAQLFAELINRALSLQRLGDIPRILQRATKDVDEQLTRGDKVDDAQLAQIAVAAVRASIATCDPSWGVWAAQVYLRLPFVIPEDVVTKLGELAQCFPDNEQVIGVIERVRGVRAMPQAAQATGFVVEDTKDIEGATKPGLMP
ncbi:MAG: FHA domain-containing protein [Polyangiaceae bacterium]|nr:FHA domain-containing protein [Polyangiaceae bacterium]